MSEKKELFLSEEELARALGDYAKLLPDAVEKIIAQGDKPKLVVSVSYATGLGESGSTETLAVGAASSRGVVMAAGNIMNGVATMLNNVINNGEREEDKDSLQETKVQLLGALLAHACGGGKRLIEQSVRKLALGAILAGVESGDVDIPSPDTVTLH